MSRQIESHRLASTGEHIHQCPLTALSIGQVDCLGCQYHKGTEQKAISYEVQCDFPTSDLIEFDPSHAVDQSNLPQNMKAGPFGLQARGWNYIAPKLDGARGILHLTSDGIRVTLRRRNSAGSFTEITNNLPHFKIAVPETLQDSILDVELMMPQVSGKSTGTLGSIMSVVGAQPAKAINFQRLHGEVQAHVFDIVRLNGNSVVNMTYEQRRMLLQGVMELLSDIEFLHLMPVGKTGDAAQMIAWHEQNLANGAEGSVVYHQDFKYGQTYGMLKAKQTVTIDCIVVGFEYGAKGGAYEHQVGSLRLAVIDKATGELREVGKVVPGDNALRAALTSKLEGKTCEEILAMNILLELEAQTWTKEYKMRHPRVLRYREDKSEVTVVDFTQVERN